MVLAYLEYSEIDIDGDVNGMIMDNQYRKQLLVRTGVPEREAEKVLYTPSLSLQHVVGSDGTGGDDSDGNDHEGEERRRRERRERRDWYHSHLHLYRDPFAYPNHAANMHLR